MSIVQHFEFYKFPPRLFIPDGKIGFKKFRISAVVCNDSHGNCISMQLAKQTVILFSKQ